MQSALTILKIFGLSTLISIGIKYVGPRLLLPGTDGVALIMVTLPPIVVAGLLWIKELKSRSIQKLDNESE